MKVQVNCLWYLDQLETLLHEYKDKEIVTFLKYGWPISHNGKTGSTSVPANWPGASQNTLDVRNYFDKELANNAYFSPLNTQDKKDSAEKCIIVNMLFPKGNSINDGIKKDYYLNEQISLKYPTVDKLVEIVKRKGKGACYSSVIFIDFTDKFQFVQKITINWELFLKGSGTLIKCLSWDVDPAVLLHKELLMP